MFGEFFLFTLTVCSVRAADRSGMEPLAPLGDQHPIPGRFIIYASGSNNTHILDFMETFSSSWIEISPTEKDVYSVTLTSKRDECFYRTGEALVEEDKVSMKLYSDLFDSEQNGVFLDSLDDDVSVWIEHVLYKFHDRTLESMNMVVLIKAEGLTVREDTMQRIRSHANCEGIKIFEMSSTTDLCGPKE